MKKNLLLAGVLLCTMAMTSCLEDSESLSVTNIRDAKVEQLKSIAAINNAQAEATKKLAEADAALKTAQAEAIKAETQLTAVNVKLAEVNVELAKVQLDGEKVKLEMLQAELEATKADLEVAKAQAEANIKRIAANLEVSLMEAKTALLQAQSSYNSALADFDEQKKIALTNLLYAYTTASMDLLDAQQTLANDKTTLARLESNLVSAEQVNNELIADYKEQITFDEAKIEQWKAYEGVSRSDLEAKCNAIYDEIQKLDVKLTDANYIYGDCSDRQFAVLKQLNNSYYKLLINKFTTISSPLNFNMPISYVWSVNNLEYNKYAIETIDPNTGLSSYTPLFSKRGYSLDLIEDIIFDDGTTKACNMVFPKYAAVEIYAEGFDTYFKKGQQYIDDNAGAAYKIAKDAYDAAVKAEAAAKTAAEAEGATQAVKDAYYQAQKDTDQALTNMNSDLQVLQYFDERLAEQKGWYADMVENMPIYNDLLTQINDYSDKMEDAYVEKEKLTHAITLKENEIQILQYQIDNNSIDVQTKIIDLKNTIQNLQSIIRILENENTTKEQAIERQKSTIANDEATVAKLTVDVNNAKASLDAAMK